MVKEAEEEAAALREEIKRLRAALRAATPGLDALLRRRGFKVFRKEPGEDLLLPTPEFIESFYEALKKYSFRLFLRDVIKHQEGFSAKDVTRYAAAEVTEEYIAFLSEAGLVEPFGDAYRLKRRPVTSFGATLEWFVSETLRREFAAETVWGVKFKRPAVGGDYDLIAKINGSILYVEVKSSPPKQIYAKEISAFLDRIHDLRAEPAVFFMDTELRMKDKIVPMFEEELRKRFPSPPEVGRMEKELFQINGKIYIINAKGGIAGNMEKALIWYFRRKT